jgi:predicted dehydrogenase
MSTTRKLRWGILGTAQIALNRLVPAMRESQFNEAAAIASRDGAKAREIAEKLGIPAAYGSYDELFADETIDAVYVPLPNHLHKKWAIRAAEAGKHVLCEKPISLTEREAREIAEACERNGVHLAEALMYRHHPRYAMIRDLIAAGEIGKIRTMHLTFRYNMDDFMSPDNIRLKREFGGGALYDVGCYCISAARMLLGREPVAVTYQAVRSPEHDHVDVTGTGLLEFPGGIGVTFSCGMNTYSSNTIQIVGSKGTIDIPVAFLSIPALSPHFHLTKGAPGPAMERREVEVPAVNPYAAQADDFARTVLFGEPAAFGPADAIANMRVIDACLRSEYEGKRIILQ